MPRSTNEPGIYFLLIKLAISKEIVIGKLGSMQFRKGYYIYVGSAMGNGGLRARVGRHLSGQKKMHWHIDYLLEGWAGGVGQREGIQMGDGAIKGAETIESRKAGVKGRSDPEVIDALFLPTAKREEECRAARHLDKRFEVIQKFGSSDCPCSGHLFYSKTKKLVVTQV